MPMVEDSPLGPGWEEPDVVRRTLVLPRDLDRALAEAAQARGLSPHTLLRQLVEGGLARLTAEGTPERTSEDRR